MMLKKKMEKLRLDLDEVISFCVQLLTSERN